MVTIDTSDKSRVEEIFYGDPTPDECKVILEIFGIGEGAGRRIFEEEQFNGVFSHTKVNEDGNNLEVEFLDKRVDYIELKKTLDRIVLHEANELSDNRVTPARLDEMRNPFDEIGYDSWMEVEKRMEFFLKPTDRLESAMRSEPRPSLVFELQYDVPRGSNLSSVESELNERVEEGLVGNISRIEVLNDEDSILVLPLYTVIEPGDFGVLDFDMGGIVDDLFEDITGQRTGEPRMERAMLACTMVQ